jgi:hypothetical protein
LFVLFGVNVGSDVNGNFEDEYNYGADSLLFPAFYNVQKGEDQNCHNSNEDECCEDNENGINFSK